VRIGPLSVLRDRLDWPQPDEVFEIKGKSKNGDPGPKYETGGQAIFGLPADGSVKLDLTGGKTLLTVSVEVPKDGVAERFANAAGLSGELRAAATNDAGLVLDGAKLKFPGLRVRWVEIQDAELEVSRAGSAYHFDGKATVFPFTFTRLGFEGIFGFGRGDSYLKAGMAVEHLNRALVDGFFLQKLGLTLQVNPFGLLGAAGVTFGPQFHLDEELISAARLDGTLGYLSGSGGEPSTVELTGALKIVEARSADGKVTVHGGGDVDAAGNLDWTLGCR
jgi:hypothetical protein